MDNQVYALLLAVFTLVAGLALWRDYRGRFRPSPRRSGRYVYVISRVDRQGRPVGPSKVGIAKDPERRLRAFQTANARKLVLYETFGVRNARALEQAVHRRLRPYRMKGEWFALPPEQAVAAVRMTMGRPRPGLGPLWQRLKLRFGLRWRERWAARLS